MKHLNHVDMPNTSRNITDIISAFNMSTRRFAVFLRAIGETQRRRMIT
jgi:hypothetical protein